MKPTLGSVSVQLKPTDRAGQVEVTTASVLHPFNDLETAIKRSQNYLLSEQKSEGYWVGELIVDSTLVSDVVAFHHWDGKADKEWERKAINQLFSMQLSDGGWNNY